jgi:hypothetical protein
MMGELMIFAFGSGLLGLPGAEPFYRHCPGVRARPVAGTQVLLSRCFTCLGKPWFANLQNVSSPPELLFFLHNYAVVYILPNPPPPVLEVGDIKGNKKSRKI